MKHSKLILSGVVSALGVAMYTGLIGILLKNVERLFGNKEPGILGPMAFLMLFVLSATIVGTLILGRPFMMYLNNQKKEAVVLLGYTLGWLFVLVVAVLVIVAAVV